MPAPPRNALRLAFAVRAGVVALVVGCGPALLAQTAPASPQPSSSARFELGVAGRYKLGHWTRVRAIGATDPSVRFVAPDCEGVPVAFPPDSQGDTYVRLGRIGAEIEVLHIGAKASPRTPATQGDVVPGPLAADARLVVLWASQEPAPWSKAVAPPDEPSHAAATVQSLDQLPPDPRGYDAADAVVLLDGDGSLLETLAQDKQRTRALRDWVESGGRLVVACGGPLPESLGEGGELSWIAPGRGGGSVPLPTTTALETWIEAPTPAPATQSAMQAVRFLDVQGEILVSAGRRATDLPLVVERMVGFGAVVFVAIDLNAPHLRDWDALPKLAERLLDLPRGGGPADEVTAVDASLVASGYGDVAGAVRERLGAGFVGVSPPALLTVVALVLAYLVCIGPIDYYLGRSPARPWAAWVTLPLWLAAFGGGAAWLSTSAKGSAVRVNQIEAVDIDNRTGFSRGALWAQLYAPSAQRFDLSLLPHNASGEQLPAETPRSLSWFGLSGAALGGMESRAVTPPSESIAYAQSPDGAELQGLPINTGATAALSARWTDPAAPQIEALLEESPGALVEGEIVNNLGVELEECELVYGDWAWRLGKLSKDESVLIDPSTAPLRFKTIVARDHTVQDRQLGSQQGAGPSRPADLSTGGLVRSMLFWRALGRERLVGLPLRHHGFADLSRHLDAGRAMLIARCKAPRSTLANGGDALTPSAETSATYYRFLLDVASRRPQPSGPQP